MEDEGVCLVYAGEQNLVNVDVGGPGSGPDDRVSDVRRLKRRDVFVNLCGLRFVRGNELC